MTATFPASSPRAPGACGTAAGLALAAGLLGLQPLAAAQATAPIQVQAAAETGPVPRTPAPASRLPAEVEAALEAARIPPSAMAVWVQDLGRPAGGPGAAAGATGGTTRIAWQADLALNPASLMKLLPTFAALETLGPAYTWRTPVWLQGSLQDGVLEGSLVIKGQGDPRLVVERVWGLLRRVQQLGVREIRGDIVLDRSAFSLAEQSPGDFDGEPLRPYNVGPDALLLNQRVFTLTLMPDPAARVARVAMEPALAGVSAPATVPLLPGPCADWRAGLKADFSDPARVVLAGGYAASCGERQWPVAYAEPTSFNSRLLQALWRDLGGTLRGRVREGQAPTDIAPSFELVSPPLAEVVRDINKFSNNPMAQQLFLSMAWQQRGLGSMAAARDGLAQWAGTRLGDAAGSLVVDNGSGLSRDNRLSARLLGRLLQVAWASPVMPEFVSSLPVAGADGTTRRLKSIEGRAHLKTGSLRDVAGIAGYVHTPSGRRLAVVALVNHPQAGAARPAFEALLQGLLNTD